MATKIEIKELRHCVTNDRLAVMLVNWIPKIKSQILVYQKQLVQWQCIAFVNIVFSVTLHPGN